MWLWRTEPVNLSRKSPLVTSSCSQIKNNIGDHGTSRQAQVLSRPREACRRPNPLFRPHRSHFRIPTSDFNYLSAVTTVAGR